MKKEEENKPQERFTIVEDFDKAQGIKVLMQMFKDAQSASLELVDNAVANRIKGKQLHIKIDAKGNHFFISNRGGHGLDREGLQNYFRWTYHEEQQFGVGQHGVGGKAAMGYLGDSMSITCSPDGSKEVLFVQDTDWPKRNPGETKVFEPTITQDATTWDGYFNVRVEELRRRIDEEALGKRLSEVYRPLLMGTEGNPPQIKMTLNGKEVQPLEIKYVENDPNLAPETYKTIDPNGREITIKVGILEPGQDEVTPGVRCYVDGRMMAKGLYFGHPTDRQLKGAARLIAEAHLKKDIPLMPNKDSFQENTLEWEATYKAIHKLLKEKGWIEKLKSLKVEQGHEPKKEELNLIRTLKTEFEDFFAKTGFLTRRHLPGTSTGRTTTVNPGQTRRDPTGTHASPEGETPPPLEATEGRERVKRWGAFDGWELRSLANPRLRAPVVTEDDKDVLCINTNFKAYQIALKEGKGALDLYYVETIARTIGKKVKPDSADECDEYVNNMIHAFYEYREKSRSNPAQGGDIFEAPSSHRRKR